jgi:cation diffusion facilitator family transporter
MQAKQNLRIQVGILIIAVLLFAAKLFAYFVTNSSSILSDALESIVNVVAGAIGLYSLYVASKPQDTEHPYGHGKAEFISAAVEGTLILVAGLLIIYETTIQFIQHAPVGRVDTGLFIIAGTGLVNYIAGTYCQNQGKRTDSAILYAAGKHLKTDTYSTLAIIAGLALLYFTKLAWIDKVVAWIAGIVIVYNGYSILKKSLAGIMDEADLELLQKMIAVLDKNRRVNWIDLHNLRVIKYGSQLHIDCHLTVPWYINVNEAHDEIDHLIGIIREAFGITPEFFIHTDGCLYSGCPICIKPDCPVRKHPFEKRVEWSLDNILSNHKHNIKT